MVPMPEISIDDWLDQNLPSFENLTAAVKTITRNLLAAEGIDILSVDGRTKTIKSCKEKIKRKNYKDPINQITDISGIRIISYFEHDIAKISDIIEKSFNVDKQNSLNKDNLLSTDQIGYRSVHYVCDLGQNRSILPEFKNLAGLKFEFQVRTVLQHAWAELAHDRNYKFSGKLPREIERRLFLFAGMLEIADNGFSSLSKEIDDYVREVSAATERGEIDIEINSLSISEFVRQWAKENKYHLEETHLKKPPFEELVMELNQFGIYRLDELRNIIPKNYTKEAIKEKQTSTIFGVVRDWMMINNPQRFIEKVNVKWVLEEEDLDFLSKFIKEKDLDLISKKIEVLHEDSEESNGDEHE